MKNGSVRGRIVRMPECGQQLIMDEVEFPIGETNVPSGANIKRGEDGPMIASRPKAGAGLAALRGELSIAREVQQASLPQRSRGIPGLAYVSHYRPARCVGGDYYDFLPLQDGRWGIAIGDVSGTPSANYRVTGPGYFPAMKIPVVARRDFSEADTRRVAIVNQALARRFFPGSAAIGAHLHIQDFGGGELEMGVVADVLCSGFPGGHWLAAQ